MNNNQKYNREAIKQFRKELDAMLGDIGNIDVKCMNKAVNAGVRIAKEITPVGQYTNTVSFTTKDGNQVSFTTNKTKVGGFMRKSWGATPTRKTKHVVEKWLQNTAYYSSYVNYGHRIVNKAKETIGWIKGKFILEKAEGKVNKVLLDEFRKEVERVNREHDK